ncbi:MAG: hypothetical protein ACFFDT_16905 [Candidatus Hodarchaeota archaeon]
MGILNLALKDILRQKQRSLLFIAVQSCITASGMIMYGLAVVIQAQIGESQAYFNNSIIQIFHGYLNFLLIFALMTGIFVAAILSSLLTIARMDDLAVLLTLGGTFKRIQRVPLAQIFLVTLIAGLVGWIGGIVGLSILTVILKLEAVNIGEALNLSFGLLYVGCQIIGTYFVAGFIVNLLIRKKFREIIDSQYEVVEVDQNKIWGISMQGKVGFRLAYLFNKRSKILSWVMIGGTFMLILLTTFGILGGNIISNTTNSYIERGYGTNVCVVTLPELEPILRDLYDPSCELQFKSTFLNSSYVIPASFIEQLPENCTYEARLLLAGTVRMLTDIKTTINGTIVGGGNKTLETYYWGVNEYTFSIFDYYGAYITPPRSKNVQVGDGMLQSYLNQEIAASFIPKGENIKELPRFNIEGVIMDPFARGHCVYMDSFELTTMKNIQDKTVKNVVFIANLDDKIINLIEGSLLEYFFLDIYKEKYFTFSNSFWVISTTAFIPAMISAGLSLVAYSGLITRVILIKDLRILRLLGANPKTLMRVILWVNIILVLYAAPLAVLFGFALAYSFLIADPILPSIQAWMVLTGEFLVMMLIIYRYIQSFFKDFYIEG